MRKRYKSLLNRTGVSGEMSKVNKETLHVMNEDKDICAEVVGSSSEGVYVTGHYVFPIANASV